VRDEPWVDRRSVQCKLMDRCSDGVEDQGAEERIDSVSFVEAVFPGESPFQRILNEPPMIWGWGRRM
jgi:hypothetical protein